MAGPRRFFAKHGAERMELEGAIIREALGIGARVVTNTVSEDDIPNIASHSLDGRAVLPVAVIEGGNTKELRTVVSVLKGGRERLGY